MRGQNGRKKKKGRGQQWVAAEVDASSGDVVVKVKEVEEGNGNEEEAATVDAGCAIMMCERQKEEGREKGIGISEISIGMRRGLILHHKKEAGFDVKQVANCMQPNNKTGFPTSFHTISFEPNYGWPNKPSGLC